MREDSTMRLRAIGLILTLALGSLVAPLATHAQPPLPVIGYCSLAPLLVGFLGN